MAFLGWRFDPDKRQEKLSNLPMLGNIECYGNLAADEQFTVMAKPERLTAIVKTVENALQSHCFGSGVAASLRGKILNIAATKPGRTGRVPMPFINLIADNKATGRSDGLELDLRFVLIELQGKHVRPYPLLSSVTLGPRAWSDASFSIVDGRIHMQICCIVAT